MIPVHTGERIPKILLGLQSYQVRINTCHYPLIPTLVKLRFTSPKRLRGTHRFPLGIRGRD
jgi:hypothetical protein